MNTFSKPPPNNCDLIAIHILKTNFIKYIKISNLKKTYGTSSACTLSDMVI